MPGAFSMLKVATGRGGTGRPKWASMSFLQGDDVRHGVLAIRDGEDGAAGADDAGELAQRAGDVRDVIEHVPRGDDGERAIGEGERVRLAREPFDGHSCRGFGRCRDHRGGLIQPGEPPGVAVRAQIARERAGAAADIEERFVPGQAERPDAFRIEINLPLAVPRVRLDTHTQQVRRLILLLHFLCDHAQPLLYRMVPRHADLKPD